MKIELTVNDRLVALECDPLRRLLDVLRQDLGMTDTKEGCGEGECGACTVLLDGAPVCSCLVTAAHAHGRRVLTPSRIAATEVGKLIQDSFDDASAVQCGFCFPGILVSAYSYLTTDGEPDPARVKRALEGNVCRCTGYQRIVAAVVDACMRHRENGHG